MMKNRFKNMKKTLAATQILTTLCLFSTISKAADTVLLGPEITIDHHINQCIYEPTNSIIMNIPNHDTGPMVTFTEVIPDHDIGQLQRLAIKYNKSFITDDYDVVLFDNVNDTFLEMGILNPSTTITVNGVSVFLHEGKAVYEEYSNRIIKRNISISKNIDDRQIVLSDKLIDYIRTGNEILGIEDITTKIVGRYNYGTGPTMNGTTTVRNGNFTENVKLFAAYCDNDDNTEAVKNNSIIITGGTFDHNIIYGAYAKNASAFTNNSIILDTKSDLSTVSIVGIDTMSEHYSRSNNRLEVWENTTVKSVSGLDNISVFINKDCLNTPLLTITDGIDLSNLEVGIGVQGSANLSPDYTYKLIGNAKNLPKKIVAPHSTYKSFSRAYDFSVDNQNGTLVARLNGFAVNEESISILDGISANNISLESGNDMIRDYMTTTLHYVNDDQILSIFALGNYSYNDIDSSTIRAKNILSGIALNMDLNVCHLSLSPYIEYGNGEYDTNVNGLQTEGTSNNFGFGVLTKINFVDSGFFAYGNISVGNIENDWKSKNLAINGNFKKDQPYARFGVGCGFDWDYFQISANYTQNNINGKSILVNNENIEIGNSKLQKLSAEVKVKPFNNLYVLAGVDHYLSNESSVKIAGEKFTKDNLKDKTSGRFGVGMHVDLGTYVTLDGKFVYHVGKRKGPEGIFGFTVRF